MNSEHYIKLHLGEKLPKKKKKSDLAAGTFTDLSIHVGLYVGRRRESRRPGDVHSVFLLSYHNRYRASYHHYGAMPLCHSP
jgi:hypothetical protein